MQTAIYELINAPTTDRNEDWESQLLKSLSSARFNVLDETPQPGPDQWPYLLVETVPNGTETLDKIISWLHDKGVGLVVNPQKEAPDYVFSYGMLWNFKERGEFLTESRSVQKGQVLFKENQKVLAGAPSDDYLPPYLRSVLRSFFNDNGVKTPKILVMGQNEQSHFDLCFSIESLGNPERAEHNGILEAISWFLPAHYSLVLISETGLPRFHDL